MREKGPPTLTLTNFGKEASVQEIMMVHSFPLVTFLVSKVGSELLPHFLLSLVHSLDSIHFIHTLMPLLVHEQAWLHIWMHGLCVDLAVASSS